MREIFRRFRFLTAFAREFRDDESGVTSIEYGLIAVLIAVIIVGAVTTVGDELVTAYEYIAGCLSNPSSCA